MFRSTLFGDVDTVLAASCLLLTLVWIVFLQILLASSEIALPKGMNASDFPHQEMTAIAKDLRSNFVCPGLGAALNGRVPTNYSRL